MIKTIEYYINVIHFCLYKAHFKVHTILNRLNPINLIHKIPFQRKKYEELGIDISKEINTAFSDKYFGISVMFSGGILIALFFFFFISIFNVMTKLYNQDGITKMHFFLSVLVALLFFYFLIFRQDKYLIYFEEFEKLPKIKKHLYCLFSFGFILLIFFILILSFR